MSRVRSEPSPLFPALVTGAVCGFLASWAMEQAQTPLARLKSDSNSDEAPSTEQAADRVSSTVRGRPTSDAAKKDAGRLVHYATGAGLGMLYTVIARRSRLFSTGFGAGFGLLSAVILDEVLVPALRLSKPASQTTRGEHAYSAASHLIFGAALEASRRAIMGKPGAQSAWARRPVNATRH